MRTNNSPIVLFVFNRPNHTTKTLESLRSNSLAGQSRLFIYCDGAKPDSSTEEVAKIDHVRTIVREQQWCGEVEIIERPYNYGLANNIISGVTELVNKYGRLIVLEDDIITAPSFLSFMNSCLDTFDPNKKIFHITGHSFPLRIDKRKQVYSLKYVSPWGWATWVDRWAFLETDTKNLLDHPKMKDVDMDDFNSGYGMEFHNQLLKNFEGEINTWAVKWHTSIYLNNGLCVFPRQSLVLNIGFDDSGVNCGDYDLPQSRILTESHHFQLSENSEIAFDTEAYAEFKKFYQEKILGKVSNIGLIKNKLRKIWETIISFFGLKITRA